nr:hypothetical protein [uncultured Enterobacter sp.]
MEVSRSQLSNNQLNVTDTHDENILSLSVRCVDKNKEAQAHLTREENAGNENIQNMNMSIMTAQYRIEAMLGGDPEKEDNPMHVTEW